MKQLFRFAMFIMLCFVSVCQAENLKTNLSIDKLKELSSKIEAAEKKPNNVKVDSEVRVETISDFYDPCQNWQSTPIYSSKTVWFDGGPEGKIRVDVHKQIEKWLNGLAPYGEESFSMSYDGKNGRYVSSKEGEILPNKPARLGNGGYDSGISWSLPFFKGEIYKFSKMFELACDPNSEVASELEFSFDEFEGAECIKIRSKLYDVTYWLDPSHGFALRGRESITKYPDGHKELVEFVKVTELKEIANDVWWPMEISIISRPYAAGEPWRKYVYHASNVVLDDPNFNDGIFTQIFPKGCKVKDKITGKTYIIDSNNN
jgi:hypothetical protein